MKHTITLVLAMIAMYGCKKPEPEPTAPPVYKYRLVKARTVSTASRSSTKTFEYNQAGYLVKYNCIDSSNIILISPNVNTTTITFDRDADNKIIKEVLARTGVGKYTGAYQYDIHNRPYRVSYIKEGTLDTSFYAYFGFYYDTVVSAGLYEGFASPLIEYDIRYDTLGKGQVTAIVSKKPAQDSVYNYTNIIYDDKPCVTKSIPGRGSYFYLTDITPYAFAANNPVSYLQVHTPGQSPVQHTLTIEYHSSYYPKVVKDVSSIETATTEYTYEAYR